MKYRTLDSDLTVSAVGLGCMGMSHAYGAPANKKEMTELLAQAVGIRGNCSQKSKYLKLSGIRIVKAA